MRPIGWAVGVGVVALGATADLWTVLRPELAPVSSEAMAAARTAVLARRAPGALVVHSPLFGVSELAPLGDLSARPDLPDAAARAGRPILVIDRVEAPMGGFGDPDEEVLLGPGLVLRTFAAADGAPGRRTVFDLRDALSADTAKIERPLGQIVARCTKPRPEGGFACPGQASWLYAATQRIRVDGRDQDCVWAHPTAGGAVVLTLPALPPASPGHRWELEVGSALADDAVRQTADGAAVKTRVLQGTRSLGQVVRSNAIGWARANYPLAPSAPIRLEVTAARDGRRHHCLDVRVVEVVEAPSS